MSTHEAIVTGSLDTGEAEISAMASSLVSKTVLGELKAKRVDRQADGDIRYWAVDLAESPLLARLESFATECFRSETHSEPACSFVMVNLVDSARCPNGSGGGWHRDSSRRQFKAFMYLTDVERPEQGAFCCIPGSNSRLFWAGSMVYRLLSSGNRYSDLAIAVLLRLGFRREVILRRAGVPFFLNTSLIHRGLPISEGMRVMATVYIFEDVERMSPEFKTLFQ